MGVGEWLTLLGILAGLFVAGLAAYLKLRDDVTGLKHDVRHALQVRNEFRKITRRLISAEHCEDDDNGEEE